MGRKRRGRHINGWFILNKPSSMTSAKAVHKVRDIFGAAKAGHAGTLDPLATGVLPIALGEATKVVSKAVSSAKSYRFTILWGEERETDDAEGRVIGSNISRPTASEIEALLPKFIGLIDQVPPVFSAIKVGGIRAYDLARRGLEPSMTARQVRIDDLRLEDCPDADHATLVMTCGKGAYVRGVARDLGRLLGCLGHVIELHRVQVGCFDDTIAISLDKLDNMRHKEALDSLLLPVEAALADIPAVTVTDTEAKRLRLGQAIQVPNSVEGTVYVTSNNGLVALAEIYAGDLQPVRVFNL